MGILKYGLIRIGRIMDTGQLGTKKHKLKHFGIASNFVVIHEPSIISILPITNFKQLHLMPVLTC
jgi:hypothetical protein